MFKDILIQKLAEQNITRNSLAEKAGIKQSSFSRIMTGDIKNPGVHTVAKIAKELNCSIDELIGRKVKGGAKEKDSHQVEERLEFDPKLAATTADAVLNLLDQAEQKVKLEDFLSIAREVYQYSLDKNSDMVDEHFAKWFIKNFFSSKDSN